MDRKIMFCWAMVVTMRVSDGEARGRRGMGTWKVTKSMLEYTVVFIFISVSHDSRKEYQGSNLVIIRRLLSIIIGCGSRGCRGRLCNNFLR